MADEAVNGGVKPVLEEKIDQTALLVEEFGLEEVCWSGRGWKVKMASDPSLAAPMASEGGLGMPLGQAPFSPARRGRGSASGPAKEKGPSGQPVSSPMMGIYYSSPSPGSRPFVEVGSTVQAGDVVAMIEAMKVFNEITAPFSGTVVQIPVENGQLVQPGEVLVLIG